MITTKDLLGDARAIQGTILLAETTLRSAQDKLSELILSLRMLELQQKAE